jgi:multiple sugar transport system substrate-binding protein
MARLAKRDPDHKVLDISLNYGIGEWYTYGFAPVVWSAGGSLGRAPTYADADQTLATPGVAQALQLFGAWNKRYVDPNDIPKADAFTSRRVPLSWGGHWRYPDFSKALGKDLIVLPLPDFGNGAKMDSGSWNWGVTTNGKHPSQAATFLNFVMSPDEVLAASAASGAPPGTTSGAQRSPLYQDGGPLALFSQALASACPGPPRRGCDSMSRPPTPAYPVITNAFQSVMKVVFSGGDVNSSLASAAEVIDTDNAVNKGYRLGQ